MDVTLREARAEDYAAVDELATEWGAGERRETFASVPAHRDRTLLVAEVGGEVVGFADVMVYPDLTHGALAAELMGLVVREDHRRQGIARVLLDEACQLAAEREVGEFHICTEQENVIAQRLYASRGAEVVGVQMEIDLTE